MQHLKQGESMINRLLFGFVVQIFSISLFWMKKMLVFNKATPIVVQLTYNFDIIVKSLDSQVHKVDNDV